VLCFHYITTIARLVTHTGFNQNRGDANEMPRHANLNPADATSWPVFVYNLLAITFSIMQ
jgi:hypothetical protein